jgi:hypothetical protein
MKKLVRFALAAFFLLGIAAAQNLPEVDVFGGYSYYSFYMPANPSAATVSQRLALNGADFSLALLRWHHLSAEADVAYHSLGDCVNTTFSCSNFSYLFGPRYNFRDDPANKITGFFHVLAGGDHATLSYNGSSLTDNSIAVAAGAAVDYWVFHHIGVQLGPVDYVYTRHLSDFDVPSQNNFRAAAGIIFRFGGAYSGESTPKVRQTAAAAPAPVETSRGAARQPVAQPAPTFTSSRGMTIAQLGVAVVPQEFDGAKIVDMEPGGVGEMASMKVGDLIKSVDGKPVRTPMELLAELSDKAGKVRIGIQRGDFTTETLILIGPH